MKKQSVVFNTLESNVLCFFLCMLVCVIGVTSCTDNDDDDGPKPEAPVVSEELMPFVGYWEPNYSDAYGELLLFDDGTCRATHPVDGRYVFQGKWTFDAKTNYFSNSATNKTFLLTLHNETTIMGVDISNQKTVTYTKNVFVGLRTLVYGTWKTEGGQTLSFDPDGDLFGDKVPQLPKNTGTYKYYGVNILFSTQDKNPSLCNYMIRWYGSKYYGYPDNRWYDNYFDSQYKGELTIEHPYSPSKCRLIFTGVLEGIYTRAEEKADED